MATIERTAYPRFPKVLAAKDMQACYTPQPDELEWARRSTRGERPRLGLLVLLKVFQQLHHFPPLDSIPAAVVEHVRAAADIGSPVQFGYDTQSSMRYVPAFMTRKACGTICCACTASPTRSSTAPT